MSRESMPILRRSCSSSAGPSSTDPYDQAEQGFQVTSTNPSGARQPLEARKTLSLRHSLRSSDSTLVGAPGEPFELAVHNKGANPLPRQGKYRPAILVTPNKRYHRTSQAFFNMVGKQLEEHAMAFFLAV